MCIKISIQRIYKYIWIYLIKWVPKLRLKLQYVKVNQLSPKYNIGTYI